jgi:membrane peptidoglycan carboxypeptidase
VLRKNKTQGNSKSQQEGDDHKSTDSDTIGHLYCYQRGSLPVARKFLLIRRVPGKRFWQLAFIRFLICMAIILTSLFALGTYLIYFDRTNLPSLEPLTRFEFATIGHIYDVNGLPLMEMAREYRLNIPYRDIPPVVRDAILAAEDKNFFTHNGVDYSVIPRVSVKSDLEPWQQDLQH